MIEISSSEMALLIVISLALSLAVMFFGMRLVAMRERRTDLPFGVAAVAFSAVLLCYAAVGLGAAESGGEDVGEPLVEMTDAASIRSFSESESESTSFSGRMVDVLVFKSIGGKASTSSHSKYTVMEDAYGDGGYTRVEYPAESVRIYEDVDESGENPRVEKFEKKVVRRIDWLVFYNEEERVVGKEVRIHVAPGTVFDFGE